MKKILFKKKSKKRKMPVLTLARGKEEMVLGTIKRFLLSKAAIFSCVDLCWNEDGPRTKTYGHLTTTSSGPLKYRT